MRSISFFVFLTLASSSIAAEKLAPHGISLCSQILMTGPQSAGQYHGDLHYFLRDMDGVTLSAVRELDGRKLNLIEKVWKSLDRTAHTLSLTTLLLRVLKVSEIDFKTLNDHEVSASFLDPMKIAWSPANEITISTLVGRIGQLENDFVEAKDAIAFGYEVRGEKNILDYFKKLFLATDLLEAQIQPAIEKEFSYFSRIRLIEQAHYFVIANFWIYVFSQPITKGLAAVLDKDHLLYTAVLFIFFGYEGIKNSYPYIMGIVSEDARNRFKNHNESQRTSKLIKVYKNIFSLLKRMDQFPAALIYIGMTKIVPTELRNDLLEASGQNRSLKTELVFDAILKDQNDENDDVDQNFLLVDQIFFFDKKTLEPVLVNFVRIKNRLQKHDPESTPVKIQKEMEPALGSWAPSPAH